LSSNSVARRITGLDNPADRATEMPKLFPARPAPTLFRRRPLPPFSSLIR
jgi:hypothetical protein